MASSATWAQKLDDSLLEQSARDAEAQEGQWMSNWMDGTGELGGWSVWLETDVSVVEELLGQTTNNLRDAAQWPASWSNSKLTNVLNRMNNGFDNVVDNWGRYVPNHVRIGASKTLQHNLSWVRPSWQSLDPGVRQLRRRRRKRRGGQLEPGRHADLVDQFLFYDDLYNGNLWEFQSADLRRWTGNLAGGGVRQPRACLRTGLGGERWILLGMNAEIDRLAASFSGARGELSPDELGATLTPVSSAAASMVASLGATYRFGPVQAGLLWSSQSLAGGSQRNDWVAAGAEDIKPSA